MLLFAVAVLLQIHGSSIGVWKDVLRDEQSPSGILFSTAKSVRSDEWMAWTPSILSQIFHRPPFPVENANLGAGKSPLLMSVPVRHFAMIFRPQLWGFFVFEAETAFAFYWNAKICALFLSFFFLFRLLTRNDFWLSLFGAGWVWFSAYVQWWFSCPPMMPEMLASWAIAITCAINLFHTESLAPRMVSVVMLVGAGVNFILCFYPPFQIPLMYLGVAVIAGWLWQHRHAGLRWKPGTISLAVAALGLAVVLIPYIRECRSTLELLSNTKYPGSRRTHGGELTITDAFNGVLGFFNWSERDFLATRGNPSEASNFYPLWVFALLGSGIGLWRDRRARSVELLLLGCVVVFTLYIFCPFPVWLCHATLLDYVTGTRAILAAGIAGILLTTMLLAKDAGSITRAQRVGAAGLILVGLVAVSTAAYAGNEKFLTGTRIASLLVLNILFVGLYFFAARRVFCGVFLFALFLNNGGVNPIATGLGPLLEARPSSAIRQLREADPGAKWIVFSNAWLPQLLKAQGVDVINGLQIVPDPLFCREMDPIGRYEEIWNRYAFMVLEEAPADHEPEFRTLNPSAYVLKVSSTDAVLRARGARFAVFSQPSQQAETSGMVLVTSFPANKLWIYRLP